MIYKELEKRTDEDISVHISYLEIYQETGYDLLNPGARTQSAVTPFPRVMIVLIFSYYKLGGEKIGGFFLPCCFVSIFH